MTSEPWRERLRPTRRGLEIALAFALTPLVVGMVVVVSAFPDRPTVQRVLLAATTGIWLLCLFVVRLPPDATDDYLDLMRWIRKHRLKLALPTVVLFVLAILTLEGIRFGVLAVQVSLLLWPLSVVLYQTRRFVSRAWRGVSWGLAVFTAVFVVVLPLVVLKVQEARDRTMQWWVALLLFAVPSILVFVVLFRLRADRIERFVREHVQRGAVKRTAEADVRDEDARERPRGGLALASVACAVLSSLLFLASAIRVPLERRLIETSQVAERGASVEGVRFADPAAPTEAERRALYRRYFPVLRLHEGEAWIASDASAVLEALGVVPREDCEERDERPCEKVTLERGLSQLKDFRPRAADRVFAGGAVYPRLLDARDRVRALGGKVPQFARSTAWLLQYWLFYPNNEWTAESAVGTLLQSHGGDWEWVGVGLGRTAKPVFVAYSAHCTGTWRPWSETASVAVAGRSRVIVGGGASRVPPSHPLVIVALGSHANYATPGTREPDWGSCQFDHAVAARAMQWLTFITAAREETPDLGPFQVPKVLEESDTTRDAERPLWWGEQGETRFEAIGIAADDHGPASPFYQTESWFDPIDTIFDSDWKCDVGKKACKGTLENITLP